MLTLTFTFVLLAIAATALPFINSGVWWIRIFDFPRIQIAVFIVLTLLLTFYVDFQWIFKLAIILILVTALLYQLHYVVIYTPLYRTQAKYSKHPSVDNSLTLLVSNIRMDNTDKERFLDLVKKYEPDILLINEPDQAWTTSIETLEGDFPFTMKYPLGNTFGMLLLSKFALSESSINFIVKDDIPSFYTKITLPSGILIDFYGVHPMPPMPGTPSYERDTELLVIGKKIRESLNPTIVAGDLNDVGWSVTSKLFRKYSRLVDPREGRGLFNTYNVNIPFFRYPLDHIFYSIDFGLLTLEKLEDIGSDHYPLLIRLNYEPDEDTAECLEKTSVMEDVKIEDNIKQAKDVNEIA